MVVGFYSTSPTLQNTKLQFAHWVFRGHIYLYKFSNNVIFYKMLIHELLVHLTLLVIFKTYSHKSVVAGMYLEKIKEYDIVAMGLYSLSISS